MLQPDRHVGCPTTGGYIAWRLQEGGLAARFLLREWDSKFTAAFTVFRTENVEVIQRPYRRPVADSFAERWIGTVRGEVPRVQDDAVRGDAWFYGGDDGPTEPASQTISCARR